MLFTGGLEPIEFSFVAVKGAADAAFVAGEEVEGFGVFEPGAGGAGFGVRRGGGEDAFFDGVGALEPPDADGDFVGETGLDGAGGLVVRVDIGVVFLVGRGFVGGEDEGLRGEAMAEGVETAAGFAFGGAGARGSGLLGVGGDGCGWTAS